MLPHMFTAAQGSYLVHPQVVGTLAAPDFSAAEVKPFVVVGPEKGGADRPNILGAVSYFAERDDVFSADFLTDVVGLLGENSEVDTAGLQDINTALGPWSVKSVFPVVGGGEVNITPGPYFLCGNNIHQAWRLYPDHLDALSISVYPQDVGDVNTTFKPLHFLDTEGIWKNIAVPSRLYHTPTKDRPLAGQRITIKDNYRLAGVKSTFSSRPYEATYGPNNDTAAFVQKLIGLGAVVVGKSKMSSFASAEEPTDQWVDFHAPFNPRGDGYQTPAGSSNGAAAALSGYPWLDFCIGTDTSGSIRYPAAICGLFGLRYTSHTLSTEGIAPACSAFDTVGLLGRDLKSFRDIVALTAENTPNDPTKFPTRILYPTDFLPYTEEPVQAILEEFVKQLESYLGVTREEINIAEVWEKNAPPEAEGKTIKQFLDKTGFYPFYYDGYNLNKQFLEDYRKKFGKEVYFGPYMRWKMETGSKVTLEQKEQGLREGAIYRKWFAENVLRKSDDVASDAVLIMPLSCYAPDYRDNIHGKPGSLPAHSENYLASILRLPQVVLPVGQVPYESRASGRREYHPITASLVGAGGSDLMLVNLARATFAHAQWGEELLTGRFTWELGDGARNVAEGKSGLKDQIHEEL